jgi:hypothetical protein
MQITFELAITTYDVIELRWPSTFGKVRTLPYHLLADCLLAVDGVDAVDMRRYTARIHVAPHVTSLGRVVQALQTAVIDDVEFGHVLERECGITAYHVVVMPDVVTRQ